METLVKQVSVSSKGCIGCNRFSADVMLTLVTEDLYEKFHFNDFFLNTEQVENLIEQLSKVLELNKEVE